MTKGKIMYLKFKILFGSIKLNPKNKFRFIRFIFML